MMVMMIMMTMIMIKRMMLFTVITKRRSEATVKENQTKMGNQKTYNIGPFVQNCNLPGDEADVAQGPDK